MKKTLMTVASVAIIGLGSTYFVQPAHAETVSQLQNKQTQIQTERTQLKANLSKAEQQIADILIDLEQLTQEIQQTEHALKENQKHLDQTEEQIVTTQDEIDQLEESIQKRYDILSQRAVSYQRSGGNIGFLDVIFGSKSFGDFISRVTAVNKITESDKDLMDQIEAEKNQVESKLTELNDMHVELEGMQALITEQKEKNQKEKERLESKQKDLKAKVKELKIKDSTLASLESQVRSRIASTVSPKPVVVASKSIASNKPFSPAVAVSGSGSVSKAISAGYTVRGTPYVWAGKGPGGFDCSGFISWAFRQAGYSLPSSTSGLSRVGTRVSASNMQPGDLVFFNTYKRDGHVGIYLGNGKFLGAQNSTGVDVADMNSVYWKPRFTGHVRRVN